MNFIRSIVNEEDIVLDSEVEDLLEQLKNLDQPRFTAAEWAAIEGGHDVSDVDQIDEDAWNRISARVSARDLAMYKFIVGAENLMQAKMFMQMAKQGRSIPKSYV